MRKHRKTILLTKTEFDLWTKKACSEEVSLSQFIRYCVRDYLSLKYSVRKAFDKDLRNTNQKLPKNTSK